MLHVNDWQLRMGHSLLLSGIERELKLPKSERSGHDELVAPPEKSRLDLQYPRR